MMPSNISLMVLVAIVSGFTLLVQGTLGVECELLVQQNCAFAVSSSGKRCVLEKHVIKITGEEAYTCKTSEIDALNLKGHVESDECVQICGLNRMTLGISSDSLLETHFTHKLCSPQCYLSCPNVVDLYFNLAAAEGVFLPKLCKLQGANTRRAMVELRSSGIVAPGPLFMALSPESHQFVKFMDEIDAPPPN